MANAIKKSVILSVVVVLLAALLFAATMTAGTAAQPDAFADNWDDYATEESQINGQGTAGNPFVISSAEDLARVSLWVNSGINTGSHYILSQDIEMNGKDFSPIGNDASPFAGSFNGGGNIISGLTINAEGALAGTHHIGLFGATATESSIKSLGIKSGKISFNSDSEVNSLYIGSVAGVNGGIIEDVFSYLTIEVSINGGYTQEAIIGGITGKNNSGASISKSVFAGEALAANTVNALGGISGENNGLVENAINAGAIVSQDLAGNTFAAGINGINRSVLRHAINTGAVNGVKAGAITALEDTGSVSFCYYDSNLSIAPKAVFGKDDIDQDTNKIKGLPSEQLSSSTINVLRFPVAIWGRYAKDFDGARYYAPYLTSIHNMDAAASEAASALRLFGFDRAKMLDTDNDYGTLANPYIIASASHFANMSLYVNSGRTYNGKFFAAQGDTNGYIDLNGFQDTIGTKGLSSGDKPFEGSFNGNNVTIINYRLDRSSATTNELKRNLGLFGFIGQSGHVYNFTIDNSCSIVGKEYSGSVAGYNSGLIENIESRATVRGSAFIGGIVGYNYITGSLRDILSVTLVLGDVEATNIFGVVGDGSFQNSSNVWYATSSSAANTETNNKGRALIIDIPNATRTKDSSINQMVFGNTDDYGHHSVKVVKDSNGKISFNGEAASPWSIEYRLRDQTVVSSTAEYAPSIINDGENRTVYARLVRTLTAKSADNDKSKLYFSRPSQGVYATTAKLYIGQEVTMYSEVPEGNYFVKAIAQMLDPIYNSLSPDENFAFTYSSSNNDPRIVVRFVMSSMLHEVNPEFKLINAPAVNPKVYDGTSALYMGAGEPYSVNISGFAVTYAYSVAGGAPKNVGNYTLTINVRSMDGVYRGNQIISYSITPRSLTITTDMLTRQKEYDGVTTPVSAPVINQHSISEIVAGDAIIVTSMAKYATTDIGATTANFTFALSGTASINYNIPADMNNVSCEIIKRTLIIEITDGLTYVYDGNAAEISSYGYLKAPLVSLKPVADIYMSTDIVGTRVVARNVGQYDVNVRLKDTMHEGRPITYYYTVELKQKYTFTITPRPVDITYGDYEGLVYNGAAQSIKAYYNDISGIQCEVLPQCLSYSMIAGSGSSSEPNLLKNAGSYIVTVTLPVGGNYIATQNTNTYTVNLGKANQPVISITPLTAPFVYGDSPRTLTIDGAAADSTGAVTYTVLSGRAIIIGDSLEFTGGGDIYLSAAKEADFNYHAATTANYRITVSKAVIKIDLADIVKIYGDTLNELVFIFEDWADRDMGKTIPDGFVPPSVKISGIGIDEAVNKYKKYNAGIYTLNVEQDATSFGYTFDYSLLDPMPQYTVQQKEVVLRPDDKQQTYGRADAEGNPEDLPLTYTVLSGEQNLSVTLLGVRLTREAGISVLPANGYYAISCENQEETIANNSNYSITFQTGKYTILPKTLIVTATSQSKTFGDPDPAPQFTVSGLAYQDEKSVVAPANVDLPILTREAGENAYYRYSNNFGVYYYSSSNIRLSSNYTLSFVHGTLTIYKARPVFVSQSNLNVPYGDNIGTIKPSAIFNVTIGSTVKPVSGTLAWISPSARPTFDGDNRFTARFMPSSGNDANELKNNVASIDVDLTVNIYKRRVELSIQTLNFVYTGRVQTLRYTVDNVLEGDNLNDSISYSATMRNAGNYTVTISINNGNYTLLTADDKEADKLTYNITVKKAPLIIYLEDIELGQGEKPLKNFVYEGFVNGENESSLNKKPDVVFKEEPGNHTVIPFGAESDNYEITYRESKQSVTKTILTSQVQNFSITGNFDFQTEMKVVELQKNANRGLFSSCNSLLTPIKSINKLGNVQISRIYDIDITVDGESAALKGINRATIEIPARLRESKKFFIVLIAEDGSMKLAQNVVRNGNNLSFDIEDCSMVGIVNPPDYTFIILGCVVVVLVIAVFALDIVSERLGIGRHKKKKADKPSRKN